MYAFEYARPTTLGEAVALAGNGAKPLAGGQTLLASMKLRLSSPESLADLAGIAELKGIRHNGNMLEIGAMTRHVEVATNAVVKSTIAALADMASHIGDRQVRTLGTLGGSLANNDPSACYPAALLGLGGVVKTTRREIAADDFFEGMFATALKDDEELITSVAFNVPRRAAYMKFRQPASRFALIGVFVAETSAGVRVAVTGGGHGVFRHKGLEEALSRSFTAESAAAVKVEAAELTSDLHASAAYRANLIGVQTQRAVVKALEG